MNAKTRCSRLSRDELDRVVRLHSALEDKNRQNEPASDATKLAPLLLIQGASRSSQP